MNEDAQPDSPVAPASELPLIAPAPASRALLGVIAAVALVALLASGMLWQKLSHIQELLARQSADTGAQSVEARALAKQAIETSQEATARAALFEARLSEVALQRTQLEELMQSLSRSRDENLVVDMESSIRLAQQQTELTGSVEPLLAALRSADQRVTRAAQPRLTPVQRAIAHDMERIKSATVSDTPGLLIKLDDLIRQVDDLVLANAVASARGLKLATPNNLDEMPVWWRSSLQLVFNEVRSLVRVSRVELPEAALLSPEQSFFVRENLKLKLLNARLGLLARQIDSSRADLSAATVILNKYFDAGSRRTQTTLGLLQQVQSQMKTLQVPQVNETLAALATAAAGR